MKMAAWRTVRLGEVCRFRYGDMPKKSDLINEGYPVYSGYRLVGCSSRYHYREPEIIVVARGVGGTGDIKMTPPFCFLTNLSIAILLEKPEVFKPFLYYRLSSTTLWELRTGSAQAQITIERLKDYEVELPPLPMQQRIAGVLSAYDEMIENSQRRIRILEEMSRALYREWFVQFRFPGHEKVGHVDSAFGSIPQGWEIGKLGDVAEVNCAQISPRTAPDKLRYIDISSVSPGQIDETTTYSFAEAPGRARRIVRHGDVLWSCVRPNRRSHALVLEPEPNTIASTGFAVLTATKIPFTFLYLATTTDDFVTFLVNNATGSAYPAVTATTFENADLVIPSASLLKKFGEVTTPMAEEIHALQLQIKSLRLTRDLLLPRLISGQINLSPD